MTFYSKEEHELIKRLNNALGMNHRTKPYDFKNSQDVIQAITMVTAEYFDMAHYWSQISRVNGDFGESLETFYPAAWMRYSEKSSTGNPRLNKVIKLLTQTSDILFEIMEDAESRCAEGWRFVLTLSNEDVMKHFFGDALPGLDKANLSILNDLYDVFDDCQYKHSIEESSLEFARVLKEKLFPKEAA